MFKLPSLPAKAGQKRRMPDAPAPGRFALQHIPGSNADDVELLKKYRPTVEDDEESAPPAQSNGKGKERAVTVAEEDEDMSYAGRMSFSHSAFGGSLLIA